MGFDPKIYSIDQLNIFQSQSLSRFLNFVIELKIFVAVNIHNLVCLFFFYVNLSYVFICCE